MKLVILESPTKTIALKKYLGSGYTAMSSNGHVLKLSSSGQYGLGLDLESFEPKFSVDRDKKVIVQKLKEQALKASKIFIATDPDREGEAIAHHLANVLDQPDKTSRVVFNEITKSAVLKAFEKPRSIDQKMVDSQFTRRIIDRMIGYRLSKTMQRSLGARSAGRVQSIALKIITDREKEIAAFTSKKTWEITAFIDKFAFLLTRKKTKKLVIDSEQKCDEIFHQLQKQMKIAQVATSDWKLNAPLPLKTATLLQIAARELGYSAKKTMFIAQKLYEGIKIKNEIYGLISYPRTDSHRINSDFAKKIRAKIKTDYGAQYLGAMLSNSAKKGAKIQDAHEAIRITDIELTPDQTSSLLPEAEQKLYSLIYKTTFAAFMPPITGRQFVYEAESNDYFFKFTTRSLEFDGFSKVAPVSLPLVLSAQELPKWTENQSVTASDITTKVKVSKPPARYSEARLIKTLESFGIGRPSTYSTIVSKLINWNYLSQENRQLTPTSLGAQVIDFLALEFSNFVNEGYTAEMETALDKIAAGEETRIKFLNLFWHQFNQKVIAVLDKIKEMEKEKITDKPCPDCGGDAKLQERNGRFGTFLGCANYPKCKYIDRDASPRATLDRNCPKCNKPLAKRKGKYGEFVGCTGYPQCRFIENSKTLDKCPDCQTPLPAVSSPTNVIKCPTPGCNFTQKVFVRVEPKKLDRTCPNTGCGQPLVERRGRFGKFVACSGFPQCRYIDKKTKK